MSDDKMKEALKEWLDEKAAGVDYIEVFTTNYTGINNIIVSDMNVIVQAVAG